MLSMFNPFSGKKGLIGYILLCLFLLGVYLLLPSSPKRVKHYHSFLFQKKATGKKIKKKIKAVGSDNKGNISSLDLKKVTGVEGRLSFSHELNSPEGGVFSSGNFTEGGKGEEKGGGVGEEKVSGVEKKTEVGMETAVKAEKVDKETGNFSSFSFSSSDKKRVGVIGIPCSCDKDGRIFVCRCGDNRFLGCVEGGKGRVLRLLRVEKSYFSLKRKYYSLLKKKKKVFLNKEIVKKAFKEKAKSPERKEKGMKVGIVCLNGSCNLVIGNKSYREGAKIGEYSLWKIYVDGIVVAKGEDGAGGVFFVGKDSLSDFVRGLK